MKLPTGWLRMLCMATVAPATIALAAGSIVAAAPTTQPITAATHPTTLPYDEFQQAADLLHLSGPFLDRFEVQVAHRHAAFANWQLGETGRKLIELREQLDGARKAHDAGRMKAIQSQIAPLSREEIQFRSKIRAEVWALLSLDQHRLWAAHVLELRTRSAFAKIELSPDQHIKAQAIYERLASDFVQDGTLLSDPYLKEMISLRATAIDQISREVLTEHQRVFLAPATRPTTNPATRPV